MASSDQPMTLTFRCPKELEGLLPAPMPAASGLPDWLKTMPQQAFSAVVAAEDDTVKRCPPFVDAMTSGFLIPLICDVSVERRRIHLGHGLATGRGRRPRPLADRLS